MLPVNAAAFAPNVAEIRIEDGRVTVAIEIYIGDLEVFGDLVPDAWVTSEAGRRPDLSVRLSRFARDTFQVVADGDLLIPELMRVEARRRLDRRPALQQSLSRNPGAPQFEPPEDDRVLYAELTYPLAGKPSAITLIPPLDSAGKPKVSFGFITFHNDVPVTDFWYLSQAELLRLDWDDPWYSSYGNSNLKRHHAGAVLTFLYVDPREVRHETLIRLRDLTLWLDLELPSNRPLDVEDRARIGRAAEQHFETLAPMRIDGATVSPYGSTSQFMTVTTSGLALADPADSLDADTALIGVIASYPTDQIAGTAVIEWPLFNERITQVPATVIDAAGPLNALLTPAFPELEWRNVMLAYQDPAIVPLTAPRPPVARLPMATIVLTFLGLLGLGLGIKRRRWVRRLSLVFGGVCLASGLLVYDYLPIDVPVPFRPALDETAATEVFTRLIDAAGKAQYEIRPERKTEVLSRVVAGATFEDVSAEIDRGLAIQTVGGGLAKTDAVHTVLLDQVSPLSEGTGFSAIAQWQADASAGHWGHNHQRSVAFRALTEIVFEDDAWRLSGLTVLSAKQLE
ncbi:MAG: hypothetical protein GY798_32875 [Hyphomicrobiales bacterium]|nr:hypothetical protein [Hyphomicrobiales bacterium]